MRATKNLTQGNVYKNIILYAIPLILSSILSQAYSTVDGIIAGKLISEYALGAISSTGSFETLFNSLFNGIAAGFAIYISQLFGRGSFGTIKRSVIRMTTLVGLLSLAISVSAVVFRDAILDYLKVDIKLRPEAELYFVVYTMGYVVLFCNRMLLQSLQAMGVSSFSLYASLISAVMNVGGNLLAVGVFGMGVEGIALATILSALVATVFYLYMLRKAFREMGDRDNPEQGSFGRALGYSIPTALQQMAFHGVGFIIAPPINALGAAVTTAYNVATRIYVLGTIGVWSTASAFGCYIGQCVGEGDAGKVRKGVTAGFLVNMAMALPFAVAVWFFAKPIVGLFFPADYTGAAFQMALRYAKVFFPFVLVQVVGHFLHSYMRSVGRVNAVLVITLIIAVVRCAATLILVPAMGLDGAFWGQIISWAVDAAICYALYLLYLRTEKQLNRILHPLT